MNFSTTLSRFHLHYLYHSPASKNASKNASKKRYTCRPKIMKCSRVATGYTKRVLTQCLKHLIKQAC